MVLYRQTADTGVLSDDPGYEEIRAMRAAHCFMGHRVEWSVRHCVTVSDFLSFFCVSKVMATLSAVHNWVVCVIRWSIWPFLKKVKFEKFVLNSLFHE
jgi:hypothetical protein